MVFAGFIWKAISAKWEPPHGRFRHFSYPWSEYVNVGAALRYCAYEVMALHGVLHSEIQVFSSLTFLCLYLCVCIQCAISMLLVKVCTHIYILMGYSHSSAANVIDNNINHILRPHLKAWFFNMVLKFCSSSGHEFKSHHLYFIW